MPLEFTKLASDRIGVDLEGVTPERLSGGSLVEAQRTKVRRGNGAVELGEAFRLAGSPADGRWRLTGDLSAVHYLGAGMTSGEIVVEGPVGRHAGAGMRGGRLEIRGDAGDWLGAEMAGGILRVAGDAGDHAGAAYRGSRRGMTGGELLISGSAGSELGARMRRGLIGLQGDAGAWLGMHMLAGTIVVCGACAPYPGAAMRRGTIALLGGERTALLPTFRFGFRGSLQALHLVEKRLADLGFAAPRAKLLGATIELFHGDFVESGRGEIVTPA
jgi:formylmethanofuran dehydrogenase subunit C